MTTRQEIGNIFGDLVHGEQKELNEKGFSCAPSENLPNEILASDLLQAGKKIVENPFRAYDILRMLENSLRATAKSIPYFNIINEATAKDIAQQKWAMRQHPRKFGKYLQERAYEINKGIKAIDINEVQYSAMIILTMAPDGVRYGMDFPKEVRRQYRIDIKSMAERNDADYLSDIFDKALNLGAKVYKSRLKMNPLYDITGIFPENRCKNLEPKERFVIENTRQR